MSRASHHPVAVFLSFLLAVAGMAVSGVLLQHHVAAQIGGDPLLGLACRATETASCDDVIASKWGKVEIGPEGHKVLIPTAWFGFAWFAAVAAWYVVVGVPSPSRRWLHLVPTLLTFFALIGAVGFEYVMFKILGKYCPLCMATHGMILLLFILTLVMWRRKRSTAPVIVAAGMPGLEAETPAPSARLVFAALLLSVSMSAAGWLGYHYALKNGYAKEYFSRWQDYDKDTRLAYDKFLAQPVLNIPVGPDDPVIGPKDAKFTVVLYSDFLCPACQALNAILHKYFTEDFPGQFRMVYKHYPLDTTCNKEIPRTMHPGACAAAVAAEAVFKLKGDDSFWKLHDQLFDPNTKFSTRWTFDRIAELGISQDEFMKRVNTFSVWERVRANVAEGKRLGVDSTPALFFNGRQLKPWGDRHMWQYLLSEETLKGSATSSAPASQPASAPASQPASRPGH